MGLMAWNMEDSLGRSRQAVKGAAVRLNSSGRFAEK